MQSFFEQRTPRLDTSLPSVRHVQDLIRGHILIRVTLFGGQELEGTVHWQDSQFLALRQDPGLPLVLVSRSAIAVLRALA